MPKSSTQVLCKESGHLSLELSPAATAAVNGYRCRGQKINLMEAWIQWKGEQCLYCLAFWLCQIGKSVVQCLIELVVIVEHCKVLAVAVLVFAGETIDKVAGVDVRVLANVEHFQNIVWYEILDVNLGVVELGQRFGALVDLATDQMLRAGLHVCRTYRYLI